MLSKTDQTINATTIWKWIDIVCVSGVQMDVSWTNISFNYEHRTNNNNLIANKRKILVSRKVICWNKNEILSV